MFGALGARVLDADRITHSLMRPDTSVWRAIRARFGENVLTPTLKIDRRRLGALVFRHPRRLAGLCRIVHPAVRTQIRQSIQAIQRRNPRAVVVLDVPLLLEAGAHYRVDAMVVVSAPLQAVARRLARRSGWTLAELKRRQGTQMPLREKERRADFVVRNNGSRPSTRRQVVRIWKQVVTGLK